MGSSPLTTKWRFAVLSFLLFATGAFAQTLRFDSLWWRATIHDQERTGFVLEYFDCPSSPKMVTGASSEDYVTFVYQHLGSSSELDHVPTVLQKAHLQMKPRQAVRGGEEYRGKHGFLDGEWWGDATHGDADGQKGYTEGFLACEFGTADVSQVQRLVAALNSHFGLRKNEHDKIADVLQPLLAKKRRS